MTGFTPTTLWFGEQAGVLTLPERSAAGYRVYGDRDVERLSLIARAKELGGTLEEIAGRVTAPANTVCWPGWWTWKASAAASRPRVSTLNRSPGQGIRGDRRHHRRPGLGALRHVGRPAGGVFKVHHSASGHANGSSGGPNATRACLRSTRSAHGFHGSVMIWEDAA